MEAVFANILDTRHDPDLRHGWRDPEDSAPTATHPEAALLARGFLDVPEKEMGSIASTLRRALALWGDPRIVASTSVSDFDLGLFNQDEPITLYVVIPYADLHRLAPWVRLLLAALMRRITHFREAEKAPPLDLYLDEFASLGRVQSIHQILSFLRGYGVRAHIVIQSYDDLERLYGKGENISACQIHVVAATQSRASRRFISDLGGEATVQWERRSQSGGPIQPVATRQSRTPTEARRPLITQGEVGTLGPEEILIAKTGMPLIRARKHFYFRDRVLAARAGVPVPLKKSTPNPTI
jgi:type IV secretion system protein VirD4